MNPQRSQAIPGKKTLLAGAGITAVLGIVIGGGTYALWSAQQEVGGGTILAGTLDVERGEGTWTQITPGVANPASGSLEEEDSTFVTMPGDELEFRVPVTTTLQGENLRAQLSVSVGGDAAEGLESGELSASYRVEDAQGQQVGPTTGEAEIGQPVTIEGLQSDNAGITANWEVVVTVKVQGEYSWTDQEQSLDLNEWTADKISVDLQQIRGGG